MLAENDMMEQLFYLHLFSIMFRFHGCFHNVLLIATYHSDKGVNMRTEQQPFHMSAVAVR